MPNNYAAQDRGSSSAYASYFAGMDSSMQQKVALTTAFFPTRGRVADMGSGSGRGTYDLACLYPELELIGVDINPVSVEIAQQRYQRANLRYAVGDIADPVFAADSLDGVLDSSVLHHVTSFNDFSLARLRTCLRNQVAALRSGGVLIVRDFVIPDGPDSVLLDLPLHDGKQDGSWAELSTAALFERFAATFRSSVHRDGSVPFERAAPAHSGTARYRLALRDAGEFILRKDYRADWETELLEEYSYFSQADFEREFHALGLRVLTSVPIHNPWILRNRYRDRIALHDLDGRELPFPPTNYFIVGEKIAGDRGIALRELSARELTAPRFFVPRSYRDRNSGDVLALAERPGRTLDIIPCVQRAGRVHLLAKKGFPRPLLALHGSRSGFITEPIAAIVRDDEARDDAVVRILRERAGVLREQVRSIASSSRYFTSPGALDECVEAVLVELEPGTEPQAIQPYGDLGESGSVRELDAAQLLRAAQVGGMFDARIEIGAYQALRHHGQALDAWIGAALELPEREWALPERERILKEASAVPASQIFEPAPEPSSYLRVMEGVFASLAADGRELARASREYVLPRAVSPRTVSVLPVLRTRDGYWLALETRALPAAQRFTGNAMLEVCPAFRLPAAAMELPEIERYVREQLTGFGIAIGALVPLGGPYAPSAGATPEIVTPFAAEVVSLNGSGLRLRALAELAQDLDTVGDGHLKIALLRLLHALQ